MGYLLQSADGVGEFLLDAPLSGFVRRNGDLTQLLIPRLTSKQFIAALVEVQRTLAAEEPRSRTWTQTTDGTEVVGPLRTARKVSNDIDVVWDIDVDHGAGLGIASFAHADAGLSEDTGRMPNPAHGALVPDAHIEAIIAAQAFLLSPVQRRVEVGKFRGGATYH